MAQKVMEIAFRINGALDGSFANALKQAQSQFKNLGRQTAQFATLANSPMAKLQRQFNELNKAAILSRQFQSLRTQVTQNNTALNQARADSARLTQEYKAQVRQTFAMERALKQLQRVYRENKGSMSADERTVFQGQIQSARQELTSQRSRERESLRASNTGSADVTRLQSTLSQQRASLAQLQSNLRGAGISLDDMARHESQLRAEIERTTQAIERQANIDARRQRFENASQSLSYAQNNFSGAIDTAKTLMSPFQSALDESMNFEFAMSKVKALTQMQNIRSGNTKAVEQDMAALTAEARRLGATTEYTAEQAAQMFGYYGMAGWGTDQILKVGQATLDLATATGTDLPRMADVFSDLMTSTGLKAGQAVEIAGKKYEGASHFADIFAYATTRANLNTEALFESLKYSAPISKQWGLSFHEMAASTMVMANAGIKGSMSGTAMRAGLLRLVGPPKKAGKALEEMGISMSDAMKMQQEAASQLKSLGIDTTSIINDQTLTDGQKFTKIAGQLNESLKGLSADEKLSKIDAIFGKNAASGWAAFFDQFDQYKSYLSEMDSGVEGWAGDTAGVMRDNVKTKFEILKSGISASLMSIGDAIAPAVGGALDKISPLFSGFAQWASANQGIVASLAGVAAGLSGLIVASAGAKLAMSGWEFVSSGFGVLKDSVTGLIGRFTALSAAVRGFSVAGAFASLQSSVMGVVTAFRGLSFAGLLAGLTSPLGIAVAAATALAAAAYFVYNNWEKVGPVFSAMGSTISSSLSNAFNAVAPAIDSLISAFSRLTPVFEILGAGIGASLMVALNGVINIASTVINVFANAAAAVINLFGGLGNALASALAGDFSKAGEYLKNALVNAAKSAIEAIKSLFSGLFDTFTGLLDPIKNFGNATSGGGSFGNAENTAPAQVQTQTVSVQAQQVEQAQDTTSILQPVQDAVNTMTSSFQPVNDGMNQLSTTLPMTSEGFTQLSTALPMTSEGFTQLSTALPTTSEGFTQLSTALPMTSEGFTQLSTALPMTSEGFTQLSTALPMTSEGFTQLSTALPTVSEGITQLSTALPTVSESFNQINAGVTMFTSSLTANNAALTANNAALTAFTTALSGTNAGLAAFTAALSTPTAGLQSLGASSSSAAGSVSGLGSAASAAIAALSSAASSAVSAANSVASAASAKIAANYRGGIYSKGAFITTFAEKSAEAAIPLDNSARAVSLWERAGQILGVYPQDEKTGISESRGESVIRQIPMPTGIAPRQNTVVPPEVLQTTVTFPTQVQNKNPQSILAKAIPQNPIENIFNSISELPIIGGLFNGEGIIPSVIENLSDTVRNTENNSTMNNPIELHFEINISGNANAEDVQNGISQSIPMLRQTFEEQLAEHNHYKQRVSFA